MRILLVVPIVWALTQAQFELALVLFVIAGISDGVDGFLAKHFHWESRLGSILDPLADKFLLVSAFAALCWVGLLPVWLLWLVLARDLIIIGGGLVYHYSIGHFELRPVWSSKINTALQIILIFLVMIQQWLAELDKLVTIGIWLVVVSILTSGTEYVLVWGARAWQQIKQNR